MKLFDLGLAKLMPRTGIAAAEASRHMTGKTGSARYMAPEVALDKPYCASADVYSFGLILWQMAAHEKPFSWMGMEDLYKEVFYAGKRPEMKKTWPPEFCEMLRQCWHQSPEERPRMKDVQRRLAKMNGEVIL